VGLDRDRLTWLAYLHLGVWGYVLYGLGPSITLLRDEQAVSRAVSGLHGTALAIGALTAGLSGAWIARTVGRRRGLWGGTLIACAGVAVFCATTWLPATLLGAGLAGLGGSVVIGVTTAILIEHHREGGPSAISEGNGIAAAFGTFAPLAVGAAVAVGIGWRSGLLVAIALTAAVAFGLARVEVPDHRIAEGGADAPGGLRRRYWWAWAVIVTCVTVEFSTTIWAPEVLRERVGMSDGGATAAITAVVAGMAIGRFVGGRYALRVSLDRLMALALSVNAVGFALLWVSTAALPALVGLGICGLGMALQFPIGMSRAVRAAGAHPDRAAARVMVGTGVAIGTGPFVLGALADRVGAHRAFLIVPVLLLIAGVCLRGGGIAGRTSSVAVRAHG
jgi:predicted MFS family arabinose efflux permease